MNIYEISYTFFALTVPLSIEERIMKKTQILLIAIMVEIVLVGTFSIVTPVKATPKSGIVTIAFDDGWNSQFDNAFPLMKEHNFPGTYYIITSFIGNGDCMNMSDLHAIQDSGSEIGSHTVSHQDLPYLSDAQIDYEFKASQQLLQANNFSATDIAYPYGDSNNHVDNIALQYYQSARYAYGSDYLMQIPPTSIQMRIPMGFAGETGDSNSLAQDENIVDQAHETNSWVIIFFHNILTTPLTNSWEIEQSNFAKFLNYLGNSSVQVLTVNQVLSLYSSPQEVTVLPSSTGDPYPYSSTVMDVSQDRVFTASASGGTSPYKYEWYVNGDAVGTDSSIYDFSPTSTGLFSLSVKATDSKSNPVTVQSNAQSITVNTGLVAPTVTANKNTIDQGQDCRLRSSAIDTGTSPYIYQWLNKSPGASSYTEISGATSSSYTFVTYSSTSSGLWSFELKVTDDVSEEVTSSSLSILVNVPPAINLSPTYWTMDMGQSETFIANAVGGSGIYSSYSWYVDSALQTEQITSTFSYSPASVGSHLITVAVTDSLGVTSQQFTGSVTVFTSPTVSIGPIGPLTMDVGQTQVFTAIPNGGLGVMHYRWYLDGNQVGADGPNYSYNAITATTHSVTCKVTDSASTPATSPSSNTVTIKVNSAMSIPSTNVSPITIDQGQSSTFSVTSLSNGTAPYSYLWLQKAPGAKNFTAITDATSSHYSFSTTTSTSIGNWMFEIQITDTASAVITSTPFSLTVNSQLAAPSASNSYIALKQGETANLNISAFTTGTSPYTFQWYSKVGSNPYSILFNATSSNFAFPTTTSTNLGEWSFLIQITDGTGNSVNSTVVLVTIEAPSPSPTPTLTPSSNETPDLTDDKSTETPPIATPVPTATPFPTPTTFTATSAATKTSTPSESPTKQFPIALSSNTIFVSVVTFLIVLVVCGLAITFVKLKKIALNTTHSKH